MLPHYTWHPLDTKTKQALWILDPLQCVAWIWLLQFWPIVVRCSHLPLLWPSLHNMSPATEQLDIYGGRVPDSYHLLGGEGRDTVVFSGLWLACSGEVQDNDSSWQVLIKGKPKEYRHFIPMEQMHSGSEMGPQQWFLPQRGPVSPSPRGPKVSRWTHSKAGCQEIAGK